jgi:hypothetical protein
MGNGVDSAGATIRASHRCGIAGGRAFAHTHFMNLRITGVAVVSIAALLNATGGVCLAEDKGKAVAPKATAVQRSSVTASWVAAEGSKVSKATLSLDSVRAAARQKLSAGGGAPTEADIDALVLLVLQSAQKDAAADLHRLMAEMQANAEKKKALRDAQQKMKEKKDAISEMNEQDQLALQMAMDRKSKLEQAISNLMKKSSDTSQTIIQNLK